MKTLYLERSAGECRRGDWVEKIDLEGIGRIVVGTGPGSFAGIRSALAFAQGYALGRPGVEVRGLPSPCAIAAACLAEDPSAPRLAVVGDARQGKLWIAEFDGYALLRDVFQIEASALDDQTFSPAARVVSPDDRRIGAQLRATFGARYLGARLPTAEGLRAFAERCPGILVPEPRPIYLNPAVRS